MGVPAGSFLAVSALWRGWRVFGDTGRLACNMSDRDVLGGEDGKLSVRVSIPSSVFCVLGSALFVALGGLLCSAFLAALLSPAYGESLIERAMGLLFSFLLFLAGLAGVLFFGYTLVFFAIRLLFFWRPVFEVGPEGIVDRASAVGAGFVPWEEVKDVRPAAMRGQNFIAITVNDERRLLERQNAARRFLMRLNRRYFTGATINVPGITLSVSQREILAAIQPHLGPEARERLSERLSRLYAQQASVSAQYRRSQTTPADVPGMVPRALQWLWAMALTFFLLMTGSMLGLFGGILGWSGLRAMFGVGNGQGEWWHAPVGLTMVAFGVLLIFRLTPLVRRLSGREPPANM